MNLSIQWHLLRRIGLRAGIWIAIFHKAFWQRAPYSSQSWISKNLLTHSLRGTVPSKFVTLASPRDSNNLRNHSSCAPRVSVRKRYIRESNTLALSNHRTYSRSRQLPPPRKGKWQQAVTSWWARGQQRRLLLLQQEPRYIQVMDSGRHQGQLPKLDSYRE